MATDPSRRRAGKVDTLAEARLGLHEWRFVASNWIDPTAHHVWCVVTDQTLIDEWREKLKDADRQAWYRHGVVAYTAEVSYDPVVRPVLVCIGGFV